MVSRVSGLAFAPARTAAGASGTFAPDFNYLPVLERIASALEAIAKNSKPPRREPLQHALPQQVVPFRIITTPDVAPPANTTFTVASTTS